MKILIDMSTEHYDGLLNKCIDTWPAEYVTLKKWRGYPPADRRCGATADRDPL